MKSGVPWQVKVRPEARESAREAARRAGMSVEEWLDTIIIDSASTAGIEPAAPAPHGHPHEPHERADWDREPQPPRRSSAEHDDRPQAPVRDERPQPTARDHPYRPAGHNDRARPSANPAIAEVNQRLDQLTRQLDHLARLNATNAQIAGSRQDEAPRQLTDAISKLDRRLDKLITEGRSTTSEIADLGREKPRAAVVVDPPTPLDQALMEIADRQRALDGHAQAAATAAAPMPPESLPRARTQELSGLERELRQINTQIETLGRPCGVDSVVGKAVDALRDDLAEIGVMLQEAMPRKAVEALEGEVRKLTDRIDHSRHTGSDGAAIAGVERGLAEVRDALRALTPAENLVGVDRAVKELSRKVDLIAGNSQDPTALKQLEGAIVAMRGIVSHAASNDALAKLSEEVRSLADKVDHAAATGGGGDVFSSLERRIASLADALETRNRNGQDVPRELETVVAGLIDKIERVQLNRGDHAALGHLEDRIAKLVEKLDASDSRLNHLEAIERGLAELLIHLEHQRVPHLARAAGGPPPEVDALHRDVADLRQTDKKTQDSIEAVHGTLGHVVDRLAMIETDMRGKTTQAPAAPAKPPAPGAAPKAAAPVAPVELPAAPTIPPPPAAPVATAAAPTPEAAASSPAPATPIAAKAGPAVAGERRPIDPNLPPDHPLEPGSGVTRGRHPASAADRIAASEAALGPAKPPVIPDPGGKSNFIAAARRAAQAALGEAPARNGARPADPAPRGAKTSKLASLLRRHSRSLIVALSVLAIVAGSLHMAAIWFGPSDEAEADAASRSGPSPLPTSEAPATGNEAPAATVPAKPPAGRQSALIPTIDGASAATPSPGVLLAIEAARQAMAAPIPKVANAATVPEREVTGSLAQPAKPAALTAPTPASASSSAHIPPAPAPATPARAAPAQAAPAQAAPAQVAPAQSAAIPAATGSADKLPAAIGGALRAAALKGDPAAQFEIAQRYAEGRGIPQNFAEAAEWFERAAKQGLVPAHFRLGGLYEKGLGVKKNLDTARRFYLTAGEAGNAKALHNLAVLYAEGIDGKPDYLSAAKWFRKAAGYGVADSQYNLGILYARGIGVEQNLAEAYRWFALAAREGDREAAKKRDDVGARLDQRSLTAAQTAVQTWASEPQPEAALQVKTPPGGWDTAIAAQPAPKRKPPVVGPKLDLSIPRLAQ